MNGYISTNVLTGNLVRLAENIRETKGAEIHIGTITQVMETFVEDMTRAANRTMESAVEEAFQEFGTRQKIQAIKKVRELTGSGLKEAKDAVEVALPGFLVKEIESLAKELDEANRRVDWTQTKNVSREAKNLL